MRPPGVPGPGAYDGGDDFSLFGALTKRVASRNAQFGASGPRFPGQNPRRADGVLGVSELPGPHSYAPERSAPAGPPQMSSTFASGTKRMQLPKPPTEPKASEFETDVEVLGASLLTQSCPGCGRARRACARLSVVWLLGQNPMTAICATCCGEAFTSEPRCTPGA